MQTHSVEHSYDLPLISSNLISPEQHEVLEKSLDTDPSLATTASCVAAPARYLTFKQPPVSVLNVEVGRTIGYDYAVIGLPPPFDAPLAVMEGYRTAQHKKITKAKDIDFFTRRWLRMRYSAWRRNRLFDPSVTPAYLSSIYRSMCPILRVTMTHGTGSDTDASLDRVYNNSAYTPGNLVFMSAQANKAKANRTLLELADIAVSGCTFEGLTTAHWRRLASLANVMHPDPGSMMIMPLYLVPPPGLVISNPIILLQESISMAASGIESPRLLTVLRNITSGKAGKKILDDIVRILRAQIMRGTLKKGHQTVATAIEDAWDNPCLFRMFSAWFRALNSTQINHMMRENMRLRQGKIKASKDQSLLAWHIETCGYDK
jgi:hypothetical protein